MRETARCIAWALGLGAVALAFALFGPGGLEHADGPLAWVLFVVYAPYYLFVHAAAPGPALLIAVFAAQFLWFMAVVALVRRWPRGKARWWRRRAGE